MTTTTTTTARPCPTAAPVPQHPIYLPHPGSQVQQGLQYFYPQYFQQQQQQPQQQQQHPQFQYHPSSCNQHQGQPCDCKPKKNQLAEFVVNVPCKTTTPKPIRQIVVKVPCATTTEKPCQCQCCPCNPCKPPKKQSKPQKHHVESSEESSSHEEAKTIYKSYDPIMKKYVEAKRNNVARSRPISYIPNSHYERVPVRNDSDEDRK